MIRLRSAAILLGAVGLGLASGQARADFLVQVTAQLIAPTPAATTVGGSTVTLSPFAGAPADVTLGGGIFPVHASYGETGTTSTSTVGDAFSINYDWRLTFTHVVAGSPSGGTATIDVTGTITGSLTSTSSTLNNTFSSPTGITSITVDGATVLVLLDPYTPPGTPPDTKVDFSVGLIGGTGTGVGGQGSPEPATMTLMGIGGVALAVSRLRRKARASA